MLIDDIAPNYILQSMRLKSGGGTLAPMLPPQPVLLLSIVYCTKRGSKVQLEAMSEQWLRQVHCWPCTRLFTSQVHSQICKYSVHGIIGKGHQSQ